MATTDITQRRYNWDRLHQWVNNSLNPRRDDGIIKTETIRYDYKQYSVNDKGKKTNDYYITEPEPTKQPDTSGKIRLSASPSTVEERLMQAKKEAGLI